MYSSVIGLAARWLPRYVIAEAGQQLTSAPFQLYNTRSIITALAINYNCTYHQHTAT
jgi:hypothetical protein